MKREPSILRMLAGFAASNLIMVWGVASCQAAAPAATDAERSTRLEGLRDEVVTLRSNIFLTLVALDQVRGEQAPQGPRFHEFTTQLERMQELARAMGKRTEEMKTRGEAYFHDWEARMTALPDPQARENALRSYAERKKSYASIGSSMQQAKANFFPFVDELTRIKTLLQGSRDPKSIAEAKDLFMRANWHCIDVQRALMETEEELDRLARSFVARQ